MDNEQFGLLGNKQQKLYTDSEGNPIQHAGKEDEEETIVPPSTFLILLTCLGAISGFLFGVDTGMISGALLLIREEFDLDEFQEEIVVSATVCGGTIGALLTSWKGDAVGRKPVVTTSAVIFAAGSAVMGWSRTYVMLVLGRLLLGLAVGLSSATVPILIAEAAPAYWRGRLLLVFNAFLTFGQFAASLLNGALQDTETGWRWVMLMSAVIAAVQLAGFAYMPESPRWLLSKGREEEARQVFRRIAPGHGADLFREALGQPRSSDAAAGHQEENKSLLAHAAEATEHEETEQMGCLEALRDRGLRKIIVLGCSLQFFQQICGINTIMYYSGSILLVAGFSRYWAVWFAALVALANWLSTLLAVPLVDSTGRRPLVMYSALAVAFCLFALAVVSYESNAYSPVAQPLSGPWAAYAQSPCNSYSSCYQCVPDIDCGFFYVEADDGTAEGVCLRGTADGRENFGPVPQPWRGDGVWTFEGCPSSSGSIFNYLTIAALVIYLIFFAPGLGAMPWAVNSEIYPQRIRSLGMGLSTATNWITNFIVSVTFLTLMKVLTPAFTFALYGLFTLATFVILHFTLPETKGKTLHEIEALFRS